MKLRTLFTAMLAVACLAGCSGNSASSAPATPNSSPSVASTSSTAASSATPSVIDTRAQETADRQAVEAAWTKFWGVYADLMTIPVAQRQSVIGAVAVDPTRKQMLAEIAVFNSTKRSLYGTVVNHPYWTMPISGKATATMSDCMDQSRFGSLSLTTKQKLTVGVARDNTRASFVRGADGVWRVQNITYLLDVKC